MDNTKDVIRLYFMIAVSVAFVYFTPTTITNFYFLVLLFAFFNSKKEYFWFALVFIFIERPGGLFTNRLVESGSRLPFFRVASGFSITFEDLFILLALLKAVQKGIRPKLFFRRSLRNFLIFFVILFIFSFTIGMSIDSSLRSIRNILPYTLFVSFPILIYNREKFVRFSYLIYSILFLVLISQLFQLSTGGKLVSLFGPAEESALRMDVSMRLIDASFISLFSLITSLFFLATREDYFNRRFLQIIAIISYLSVFLTATRGWIIAYSIIFIFFIISSPNKKKLFPSLILPVLIVVIVFSSVPILRSQVDRVYTRIKTLEKLAEGDATAGGTLSRLTERGPRVMKKFRESPILGWGFSDEKLKYTDEHVGNQNILLSTGIVGYGLFLIFWLRFLFVIYSNQRKLSRANSYKKALSILLYAFIGIFIIHSTSTQLFGLDIMSYYLNKAFFLVFFFVMTDLFLKEALAEEQEMANNNSGILVINKN